MPDKKEREFRRRILDVDVNEVSLVDRAANLRRFLVVKRNDEEDGKMGAFKTEEEIQKAKKAEEEEEEMKAKKAAEEEEEKKKAAAEKEKAEKAKKAEDEEDEEDMEMKKAMNPKAIAGMLRGLKGAPKEIKAVVEWLDSQKALKADEEEAAKIKKSADETPAVQIMEDGTVVVSGQPVHKGKKFTASRTSAIKDVTMTLLKLIGEVDPAAMKSIEESMKELPKDPKWSQGVSATGTGDSVKLGKGEEVDEEKEDLKKKLAEVTKRLEKIETERPVSKSLDEEGGTEEKVKKNDSMWSGLL